MSAALTAHADPVALVPGDLDGVRDMAGELGGLARRAADTGSALRSVEAGSWVGPAGEAFRERIGTMPGRLENAADAFHDAGRAFEGYAVELVEARRQAARAVDLMADADAATATWVAATQRYDAAVDRAEQAVEGTGEPARPPGVPRPASSDPGEPLREQARRVLADARDSVAEQGSRAASRLRAAAEAAPGEPGLFSRALGQVGEFFKGAGEAAWGMVEFGFKLSPTYLLIDSAGYVSNLQGLADGVVFAVQNPKEFALAVIDWETWKDNPARALGRLVPDLLLALATGGAGAAASRGAAAAHRLDGLADAGAAARRSGAGGSALAGATTRTPVPHRGQTVYRVYGENLDAGGNQARTGSLPMGPSWTPVDPRLSRDFSADAGLPLENPGRFIVEAVLDDPGAVTDVRPALPLHGRPGGWPEYVIPGAADHVTVRGVGGVNEPWTRPPGTWEP